VPYNPADSLLGGTYILTTKEGIVYEIDAQTGDLNTVTNPNGNTLTFTDAGITSDVGQSVTFGRDAQGRIVSVTDPMGKKVLYGYDAKGDLVSVTDREGNVTQFKYALAARPHFMTEIIDPLGRAIAKNEYDDKGRLKKVVNAANGFSEIGYDPENQLETIKDALGNPTTYVYDGRGNVLQQVDALGHKTLLEYDEDNNLTKITDPNGLIKIFTYDFQGNMLSKTEPRPGGGTQTSSYTYNQYGQIKKLTLPTGAGLDFDYDSRGNQTSLKTLSGEVITSSDYDLRGNVLRETDAFGSTTYKRDNRGNVVQSNDAQGNVTTMTYDANNRMVTMIDKEGTSNFTYDKDSRETKANYGNGIFVDYGYTGAGGDWTSLDAPTIGHIERKFSDDGKLAGWVTADGGQIKFIYDAAGRLSKEIDPAGRTTEYQYDAAGRLISTKNVTTGATATKEYDAGGRVTKEIDALGRSTSYVYDANGMLASMINAKNQTWRYSYTDTSVTITDPIGRKTTSINSKYYLPTETVLSGGKRAKSEYLFNNNLQEAKDYPTRLIDAGGNDRKFTYDNFGRLKTATDVGDAIYSYLYSDNGLSKIISPTGETLSYDYDALGNLQKTTYPDGKSQSLSYGTDNRLSTVTLPSGKKINFTYDNAGRLTAKSASPTVNYTYSANGDIATLQDETGTTSYNYGTDGQLTGINYPNGSSITYTYDLRGLINTVTTKATPTATPAMTSYAYDELDNLKSVTDPRGGITTMTYDAVSRLTERLLPNGVKTTYAYDDDDQIASIIHKNASNVVLASVAYTRDRAGIPVKITREDGTYVTLEYDSALRLTAETYYNGAGALVQAISYSYDASGKRTAKSDRNGSSTYAYNGAYQLTSIQNPSGSESYSYDVDGRLSGYVRDGKTLSFSHDSYDRLTRVSDASSATDYTYDGENHRVRAVKGASTREFTIAPMMAGDLESPHLIKDAAGNVLANYVFVGSEPLMRLDASGNPIYYLTDAMGSAIGLTNVSGTGVGKFNYDGFGNLLSSSGSLADIAGGDFRFQGQWLESDSGLYNFRARDYDPKTGYFLSRDAVEPDEETPESLNPYQFAYGNPFVFSDPSGEFTILEVNSTVSIQGTLEAIIVNQTRQYLLDQVKGLAGEAIFYAMRTFLPTGFWGSVLENLLPIAGGRRFEQLLTLQTCSIMKRAGIASDNLWLQVPINYRNGTPLGDGLNCNEANPSTIFRPGSSGGSKTSVDYLFKSGAPTNGSSKAWVIGDIKRSLKTAYSYVYGNKKQWQAMYKHAQYPKGLQYAPIATYIVWDGRATNPLWLPRIQAEAVRRNIFLYLVTVKD
jgi:RHS repeat-associated protein